MSLQEKLFKRFEDGRYEDKTFVYIATEEGLVTESDKKRLHASLAFLCDKDKIYFAHGRYRLSKREKLKNPEYRDSVETVTGEIRCNERGFAFLVTESGDYYISPQNLGYALHGDKCECAVLTGNNGKNDAAMVIKILSHGITRFAGTYFTEGAFSYLRPDDTRYLCDILITDMGGYECRIGDKVFVEVTNFPKKHCPEGKIIAFLGRQYELSAEESSLVYTYGFGDDFTEAVKNEANRIESKVADNRLIDRLNLENELIFTIDGETAKDFDDAVSLTVNERGNFYLGVHIADVSEYVKYGGEIDKFAYKRGTSAYFPDKVTPMLPFELSNGICSLNEGVTRLTLSVFAEIDESGNVVDRKFAKSYIKSAHRLTYTTVQSILDGDKDAREKYFDIVPIVEKMLDLKNVLEKKRRDDGFINLDVKEADVCLLGDKISVSLHKATEATKIIEQFMLLANELVAEFLFYLELPCIYRVHDKPEKKKTEQFKEFLQALGIKVNWRRDELFPSDYQRLLDSLAGKDKFAVVNRAMLRSMKKAVYSTENSGHFGLASKCYCHFTSPIRRYPDLMVHRILKAALDCKENENTSIIDLYGDFLFETAKNSSERERLADEAERAVDDLYKVKYMESHIGEEFIGVISGVNQKGLFVELENTCEGFLPIEFLPGNKYEYDEATYSLIGKKKTYKLGDKIAIAVVGCDIADREIQFVPAVLRRNLQNNKKRGII